MPALTPRNFRLWWGRLKRAVQSNANLRGVARALIYVRTLGETYADLAQTSVLLHFLSTNVTFSGLEQMRHLVTRDAWC